MRRMRDRFTYANVTATAALVITLSTGTAYAAVMVANNSVGSPQIINGSIKSIDIGNGQVTGADVAEGTLAKGPAAVNADKLGGFVAKAYQRTAGDTSGNFYPGAPRMVSVTGYGSYGLACNATGVHFEYSSSLGTGDHIVVDTTGTASAYGATEARVLHYSPAGSGTMVAGDLNTHVSAIVTNAAGTKKILVEAFGAGKDDADSNTYNDCWGTVSAFIIK